MILGFQPLIIITIHVLQNDLKNFLINKAYVSEVYNIIAQNILPMLVQSSLVVGRRVFVVEEQKCGPFYMKHEETQVHLPEPRLQFR